MLIFCGARPTMKLEIGGATETTIRVTIEAQVSFANAIRRILLGEVPSTAIDFIEIRENGTVLADEVLANRLGLVPLVHTRPLVMKGDCDCDNYCERCAITLRLERRNAGTQPLAVTGADLVADEPGVSCFGSLIAKLGPGKLLDVLCVARRDTPQSHAKHCAVTTVGFNYDPHNKYRDTVLWAEENAEREWPQIRQSAELAWGDPVGVQMEIETVEGGQRPRDVLLAALEIYKRKLTKLLRELEALG